MLRPVHRALQRYKLTAAETSVAVYVARGDVDEVIAIRRRVKPRTVKAQVGSVLRKSDAADRAEFLAQVLDHVLRQIDAEPRAGSVCRRCARTLLMNEFESTSPDTHDPRV